MDTATEAGSDTRFVLLGRSNLKAFGFTSVEVSIKNISKRKTRSVIDDMLNAAFALRLRLIAISFFFIFLRPVHGFGKLRIHPLHLMDDPVNTGRHYIIKHIASDSYNQSGHRRNHSRVYPFG